jgi:heme/copper-type cytochrome/quinol oxidase subunit 3
MRFKDWPTRGETVGVVIGGGTLLGVLCLMASRFSSDRLKPVATFLVVSTVGFFGHAMAGLALRRRQRISRSRTVPLGVRLRSPALALLATFCQVVAVASVPAATASELGGFRNGFWIEVTLTGLLAAAFVLFELTVGSTNLTFTSTPEGPASSFGGQTSRG